MRDAGLTATQPTTYAKVDPKYSAKIADAYEAMKHDPNDPQVKAAYRAMIDETLAQWDAIKKYTGLRVDFASDKRPYPYTVPSDVIRDVRENNHMTVFPTDSGFGGSESAHVDISGNPLLESTGEVISGHKAVANDIFRIVHDYFGHVKEGVGFRANGEENAWRSHSAMYSPLARKAMTSETRGQNSWVNFGPFGEKNRTVSGEDTQYAAQKTGLMPDEFAVDNYEGRPDSLEAREQTDTPQFKKWFGDSKVVDKSGAPRIVYHGTNVDVESFRQPQRHLGATPPTGVFFFAEEAAVSNAFAEDRARLTKEGAANVMPVYLSIRNPADLTSMDAIRAALDAANLDAPRGMTSLQAFALLDNQAVVDALKEDGHDGAFLLERGTPFAAYRNAVDKKANSATLSDFSHMRNFDARVWVAFDPKQIKSAIGNNGDFNAKRPSILEVREGDTVSPRNPSGKKSAEDALAQDLQVGLESLQKDPEAFAHNITIASRYPNFVRSPLRSPEKRAERMIAHMVDNLLWLHDQMPAEIRARSQLWYDGANKIAGRWAKDYGVNRRGVAGVMAVLSPQKDWFMNVSLAQRVLDTVTKQQNTAWSPEMEKTSARIFGKPEQAGLIDAIRGKTLAQLKNLDEKAAWVRIYDEAHNARDYRVIHPEGDEGDFAKNMDGANSRVAWGSTPTIAKAISIFEDQSIENIHRQLGNEHKVRSFYNNIIDPMSAGGHVTIDTHAVAAALLRPLSGNSREVMHNFGSGLKGEGGPKNSIVLGNSGLYGLYAEAYRRAAKERGLLPRQMQSITWEAVRGLFEAKFKAQQKNVDAVNLVWDDFSKGKGTVNDVRNEILRIAGGVTAPEWVSDTRRNEASEGTADAGAVPGVGVAGGGTESNDGGGRASAAAAVPEAGEAGGVTRPDSLEVKEQTMTPEFKAWFRTSKVVDESGQPMVAYHGTNKNISEFKAGRPAWFATNPELANMFAAGGRRKAGEKPGKGSAVYPTFLRIEKPLDLGDRLPGSDMSISGILELAGLPHDKAALESLAKESLESGFVGVASFIENPVEFVAGYYTRKDRLWSVLDNLTLIGALKDAGYDGLKMREAITAGTKKSPLEAQSTTYAVFSPEQIKSAIGNNGNFDSRRPEILEAREYVDAAINAVKDAFTTQKGFGPLKAFQTQYHKAETNAHFKAVYDGVQSYLNDSNRLMNEAADLAPSLLPKLDGLGDVLKRGLSKGDLKAVSAAVFDGTLDDKVFTDAELRTRGLNDKQIGSYREARAVIDQSLTDMYTSEAVKMAKGLVPPSVLRQAKEQSDPWIVVNALANIPTKTDVQKQVYDDLRKSIAKLEDLKREGYAPLQRFGQYTVLVKNANGSTDLFTMHESEREANAFARQVRSQLQPGQTLTQGVMSQEAWKMFQGVSPDTLEIFAEALGASNKEVFQKYLKDAVNNRSTLKRLIRRKKIAGFNDDVQRTLAQFITSNARAAGRNYHWGTVLKAANEATKSAPGDVADEAVTLAKYIEAPQDEAGALRGLLFVNFLGGSVASALVNMTQPILMTFPYLAKFGMAKAAGGLVGAARIAAGGDVSDPVLRAAMERATKEGVIAPHEVAGLYAEAQRNLGGNMTVRRLLRVWGSLFSLAESFNRRITFVAAYRLAQSNGNADPYAFAEKTVAETQGVYNRGNRPNLARGAVGATLFTFKQYSIAYLEFLSRLPVKQKALALALLVMAAGAQGLPFADDIEDVIDTIAQSLGYSFNSKKELRQWAVKTLGEELGGFMTHGVSALPGVPLDIQARLGVSNLIPGTGLLLRSEADKSKEVTEVFGAAGSAAQSLVKAVGAAQEGNYKALATAALPVSVQNALKAMDMAQTGFYRDGKGRRVVDVDAADVAIKAIGFQPSVVARESRKEQDVQQDVGLVKNVGSHISDLWVDGLMEHDQEKVNTARAKLVEWNRTNPDARIIVTPQSIHERLVQAMQTRERRTIKSAPKGIRGEVLTDLRQ